jgi:hypothetical protein
MPGRKTTLVFWPNLENAYNLGRTREKRPTKPLLQVAGTRGSGLKGHAGGTGGPRRIIGPATTAGIGAGGWTCA